MTEGIEVIIRTETVHHGQQGIATSCKKFYARLVFADEEQESLFESTQALRYGGQCAETPGKIEVILI